LPFINQRSTNTMTGPYEIRKPFERLNRLIVETARTPFAGIGKPEPLKPELKGYWSRRITDEHRLIYMGTDEQLIIASCKYYYE
jgi:toxin YoeB